MSPLVLPLAALPLALVGPLPAQDPRPEPSPHMLAVEAAFTRAAARGMRVPILVNHEKVSEIEKLVAPDGPGRCSGGRPGASQRGGPLDLRADPSTPVRLVDPRSRA